MLRSSILSLALVAVVNGVVLNKRAAIEDCLKSSNVPFNQRGSDDWTLDVSPFNLRVPYTPAAIAVPTTIEHIQAAVLCGAKTGVKVTPKCGGHSYASLGLGGEDGHLVLELDRMHSVTVDPVTKVATVDGGARLGHVATELYAQGKRAISHGTCPGVGVGGHALHGGFGMSSHMYGLALDWIIGAKVVLANGTIIHASETENSDVFWALRGAGSNFGVVASFEFKTFAAPDQVTWFAAPLSWGNNATAISGLKALQDYAANVMPAELNMRLFATKIFTQLEGVFYGTPADLQTALAPLFSQTSGRVAIAQSSSWLDMLTHYAYGTLDQTHPYNMHETFFSKSLFLNGLNGTSGANFANYWYSTAKNNPRDWYFQLDMHGGKNSAISKPAVDSTSYVHRDKLFLIQFYDRVQTGTYPADGFPFLNTWVSMTTSPLKASDWGMYINYADTSLNRSTANQEYWGRGLAKLQSIKARLDPKELFYYPQSIQPVSS